MSQEVFSPGSEKMDISDTSDPSSHESTNTNTSQVINNITNNKSTSLDNEKHTEHYTSNVSKNNSLTKSTATEDHPLMYSPMSPVSPDYPDLIPEKPKNKNAHSYHTNSHFTPEAHSSTLNLDAHNISDEFSNLSLDIPIEGYTEELPEFPDSPTAMKKSLLYDMPLEISHELSDTENDKSIYEAVLSPNLQNVSLTMNEKQGNLNFLSQDRQSNKLRKIKVMHTDASAESDISSMESISDSLHSEDVFCGEMPEDAEKNEEPECSPEPIEPLSAADERKHARHWQRMVLPGGEQRTIDMRVIEPYKRVLSHGGYLRAGGHTAIVVFSACYLPDRSRLDYDYVMDNLFLYVLWTLERLVTDDYVLVYLHGGATRLPTFSWLKRCYQMVGRRLRKNLTHLYLVHPTFWIKTMLLMAKPFISSKFYRKISFVGSLRELTGRVPLENAAIPERVRAYDSLHCPS